MGTWGAPVTKLEKKNLELALEKLEILQDEIGGMFGDDILTDHFELAKERIYYALAEDWSGNDHRTPECLHPAFYGESPGVCNLCRLKVKE